VNCVNYSGKEVMDQSVIKKIIYVLPVGFDLPRVLKFPNDTLPTQCYLITQSQKKNSKDEGRGYVFQAYDFMIEKNIPTQVIGCSNFFDIFDIMASYRWIAENHVNDQIYVNVGGGSKLTAMAGMVIAGIYDHVNCFYSRVSVKDGAIDPSTEFKEILMLPKFQIEPPKESHIHLLEFFVKEGVYSKKNALEFLIKEGLIEEDFVPQGSEKSKKRSQQSLFNSLKRNFIEPMVEDGLLFENPSGQLSITNKGSQIRKIFENSHFRIENIRSN